MRKACTSWKRISVCCSQLRCRLRRRPRCDGFRADGGFREEDRTSSHSSSCTSGAREPMERARTRVPPRQPCCAVLCNYWEKPSFFKESGLVIRCTRHDYTIYVHAVLSGLRLRRLPLAGSIAGARRSRWKTRCRRRRRNQRGRSGRTPSEIKQEKKSYDLRGKKKKDTELK